jgi:hypothetical protein
MGFEFDNEPDHEAQHRQEKVEAAAKTLLGNSRTLAEDLPQETLDRLQRVVENAREAKRKRSSGAAI